MYGPEGRGRGGVLDEKTFKYSRSVPQRGVQRKGTHRQAGGVFKKGLRGARRTRRNGSDSASFLGGQKRKEELRKVGGLSGAVGQAKKKLGRAGKQRRGEDGPKEKSLSRQRLHSPPNKRSHDTNKLGKKAREKGAKTRERTKNRRPGEDNKTGQTGKVNHGTKR